LLLLWSLALQIPSFAIGRVGVDEIEDRDKDGLRDTQTNILLYINLRGCVCKIYLTFTLALKQRSKSSIFTPHKE
jgi:hypothetical protein